MTPHKKNSGFAPECTSVVNSGLEDMIVVTFLEKKLTEMDLTIKDAIESVYIIEKLTKHS